MLARKTPLQRRTALARGDAELRRLTAMPRVNAKRRAQAFEQDFGGIARVRWVQMQECRVCGDWPSECAHATSRGAGGDATDILPLCPWHHHEQHQIGVRSFEAKYGIDLAECAVETDARWRARSE